MLAFSNTCLVKFRLPIYNTFKCNKKSFISLNSYSKFNESNRCILCPSFITSVSSTNEMKRLLHSSAIQNIKFRQGKGPPKTDPTEESRISRLGYFQAGDRNKRNFIITIELFKEKEKLLRGHVEFINTALKYMEEYGVHKDLEVYKKLMDVFPKVKMVPQNMWQVEFMHYPYQQNCALEVLHQMENYGVIPDSEMEDIIFLTFGKNSHPMKKYARMLYWMSKFTNASPWPLPKPVPTDAFELAKLAVARMCSVDQASEITIWDTKEVKDSIDHTWIVSGQSIHQRNLIQKHPEGEPLKVEGPFVIFLREQSINYFFLKADSKPITPIEVDKDDVSNLDINFDAAITKVPSVHEQEDGTILAICITGSSSRDSLLSWVRLLGESNPRLQHDLPVLFMQASPTPGTDVVTAVEGQQESVVTPQHRETASDTTI